MIGRTLAHYRILDSLGAGGMGEVYRATDLRLGREVAIKTLPEEFARDPARAARFEQEARLLAALTHPHIAALHGIEDAGGVRFLVMELVPGETLGERIARGPIPPDEALALAAQIAQALEAAHEKGIVHRDLKPANVKVTPEGAVKVLDFGLAKALADESGAASRSLSPTLTAAATRAGVILGTAAYMSPEQARGQRIDRRTDVWAFGCVLYEMLTGRQAFGAETISDAISHVLTREPDWGAVPASTPAAVRRLLRRCLEKKADRRLRDLGDARLDLEEAADPRAQDAVAPPAAPGSLPGAAPRRRAQAIVLAALGIVAIGATAYAVVVSRRTPEHAARQVLRLEMPLLGGQSLSGRVGPVLSPDGSRVAYVSESEGRPRVILRALDRSESTIVPGSEGAMSVTYSPDGRHAAFEAGDSLFTLALDGGAPTRIAAASMGARLCWMPDGRLVYSPGYDRGLHVIPASGGRPVALTEPDIASGELGHWHPSLLPDGRTVVFTVYRSGGPSASQIDIVDLGTGARRRLVENAYDARWAPSGHLLFARGDSLYAAPFDPRENRLAGEALPVVPGVHVDPLNVSAQYDIAANGTLVYLPSTSLSHRLVWRDRDGTTTPIVPEERQYMFPALSPDGRRIAVSLFDRGEADLWLVDVERGVLSRLTRGPQSEFLPIWSPDGRRVAFVADDRTFTLMVMPADGSAPPTVVLKTGNDLHIGSWSPDGRTIALTESRSDGNKDDLMLLDLEPAPRVRPWLGTPASEANPKISPDGRRIVFTSDESGRPEIYVAAMDGSGGRTRISTGGGTEPRWTPDGASILYRAGDALMSVAIGSGTDPRPQAPKVLFTGPLISTGWARNANYDVGRDGRFVLVERSPAGAASLQVIVDFAEELRRRVPGATR